MEGRDGRECDARVVFKPGRGGKGRGRKENRNEDVGLT